MSSNHRKIELFCDESRQTNSRYMVYGGMIINSAQMPSLDQQFSDFRQQNRMFAELKWTKLSRQKFSEYTSFLDIYFSNIHRIYFKSLVIDTSKFDHRQFNKNNPEVGFYKFYYIFLLHSFGPYLRPTDKVIIHLDERGSTTYKLSTLAAILNNGLHKKNPALDHPISNIEAMDSKASSYMQIADILMGAVGYECNDIHLSPCAKQAKIQLCKYIRQNIGVRSLAVNTPREMDHFSIWRFDFSKARKK